MAGLPLVVSVVLVCGLEFGLASCTPRTDAPRAARPPAGEPGEPGGRFLFSASRRDGLGATRVDYVPRGGSPKPPSPLIAPESRPADATEAAGPAVRSDCWSPLLGGDTEGATTVVPVSICSVSRGTTRDLRVTFPFAVDTFGLGEQFFEPGVTRTGWSGRTRAAGNAFGNAMLPYDPPGDGHAGNAYFPIAFGVARASDPKTVGILLDDPTPHAWVVEDATWTIEDVNGSVGFYYLAGETPRGARRQFMELTGRPPVPPKQAFGLWVSEYGFDDWTELEDKLRTLRAHAFPVDGFVLDLQWFGGIAGGSEASRMGGLSFDTSHFPNPAKEIARLRDQEGVGVLPIEESYVARALPEHARMAARGFLVTHGRTHEPSFFEKSWWGSGGMVDWSNPEGADAWHDEKRQPLVDLGIAGHWCDLGEPEIFDVGGSYRGHEGLGQDELAEHDLYALDWLTSVARGYERNRVSRRPILLSRSGTVGIQRTGAAMWSGDIGSKLSSLAAHIRVQGDMSYSGVDYFGSDVGGFYRNALDSDKDELYTEWFADAAITDVPLRVHTNNVDNQNETAPDRIGDSAANLFALRRRYSLIPYYYSLAYRAFEKGDPMVAPASFVFPGDPSLRANGNEKMVGDFLLAPLVAERGATEVSAALPLGTTWFDFDTGAPITGATLPLKKDGHFRIPLLARASSIVPIMRVDALTMNTLGKRRDGSSDTALTLRVFPAAGAKGEGSRDATFELVDDDGVSPMGSTKPERTPLSVKTLSGSNAIVVEVGGRARELDVDVALPLASVRGVTVDGAAAPWKKSAVFADGIQLRVRRKQAAAATTVRIDVQP